MLSATGAAGPTVFEQAVREATGAAVRSSGSRRNVWPEAAVPKPGFREKDKVENYLHRRVCAGRMRLEVAQRKIAGNWLAVWQTIK